MGLDLPGTMYRYAVQDTGTVHGNGLKYKY